MKPAIADDLKRLNSLNDLHILDTPRQASFDRITAHCADIFDCSIALISLVDEHRQWFLSSVGIDESETPRKGSFCNYAVASGCHLLVPNALEDERFCDNPLVLEAPAIRSYLGALIKSPDGALIGTLCVADHRVGRFEERDIAKLELLAATVEDLIGAHSQAVGASYLNSRLSARSSWLRRSHRIFKQAEKIAKIGSWELDLESQALTWSDEAFAIFGSPENPPASLQESFAYYAAEDQEKVAGATLLLEQKGTFVFEAGVNAADGTTKRVKVMGDRLEADKHSPARVIGVVQDITESFHANLALQRAADRDALTDLYNRNAFDRFLQQTLRETKNSDSHAFLIMLDLDGFKDINDTFGHLVGDVVLEEISRRIVGALPTGAIVARWGGDEFVILATPAIDLEGARELGDEILAAVERQFEISGRKIGVSATCGLVEIDERSNAREIIRQADLALYHGKDREPGRVHKYVPEMERANHHRQAAIAKVREALDLHRVFAGYQPIIDLGTNRLVGLEALMRLSSSTGEQITASEVLPAILDPILSREIGDRMLDCICGELAQIEAAQPELRYISINATEADLLSRDFATKFLQRLDQAGVGAEKILLEVTETMLMVNDTATVQKVLSDLSTAGVRVALDDFGTGFSSLSHLRDFPIDKVKIDSSFIQSMHGEHQSRMIVQALINMASNLGIEVIAEGVETEEQRSLLVQLGCNLGQGFLFSPAQTSCRINAMRFQNTGSEALSTKKFA
ncbi:hypothetical protein A9995_08895 [Erythrobacter sp. QSSC1-22B]|uniref:sensor domain-containing phosphodiesterase n=1 Tax=Erythrobacter sp. QSSC1-22B TaxID=1860125 RepID=UPI000804CCBD|nr:GGDEF domain-containing protein [Erythrobacter sp. QSSC1-22B]OBX19228.1 hypothetical protein A9995_08895 [Erythrobacter sp. QSSC1-22B]